MVVRSKSRRIVFEKHPTGDYWPVVIQGGIQKRIPLLVDKKIAKLSVKQLKKLRLSDMPFDFMCMVVAGCFKTHMQPRSK